MLTYPAEAYQGRWYVEMLQRLWLTKYLVTHCESKAEEREQLLWILSGRQQWS